MIAHERSNARLDPNCGTAVLLRVMDEATLLLQRCVLYTAHDNPELCRSIKGYLERVSEP